MKPLHSALYVGHVRHRRARPHAHAFRYRIAQLYADLDELDEIVAGQRLWSIGRRNLAAFHRGDFHGDPAQPLKQAVLDSVEAATGARPDGAVRLLAHWRYYGYCFNPVSFYYCFDAAGALHSILAEITNTPWGERHAYALPLARASHHGQGGRVHAWRFAKDFHVSPFLPMDLRYDWRFEEPGEQLRVHMDVADAQGSIFDATLVMRRTPLAGAALTRFLLHYPAQTAQVALKIYWNALLIRLKRNPFHIHPRSLKG
ncbi:MAG: DUF1365 domain-containing protein [Xanthomonadales bacterium]|nr:hypothetical protein [Xanthomonadales bacterium]MCC6594683.1 DUF1365 domain-containing protein [Xanthomonadales bacterium]MCE7932234.1 DUF1365 domain-containing protein [Xanthomonadales bacterium PRO6]